ncbi:MAG: hypothetical protein ACXWF8_19065 [Methylobacter sp.]
MTTKSTGSKASYTLQSAEYKQESLKLGGESFQPWVLFGFR